MAIARHQRWCCLVGCLTVHAAAAVRVYKEDVGGPLAPPSLLLPELLLLLARRRRRWQTAAHSGQQQRKRR